MCFLSVWVVKISNYSVNCLPGSPFARNADFFFRPLSEFPGIQSGTKVAKRRDFTLLGKRAQAFENLWVAL